MSEQHPTGRLVLLSEAQRDWLAEAYADPDGSWDVPSEVVRAFDAAPADPVDAVRHQLVERYGVKHVTTTMLADVLRALGWEA